MIASYNTIFNLYFSRNQQETFQKAGGVIQDYISQLLLESDGPQDIKNIRLILDLFDLGDSDEEGARESFFLALLKSRPEGQLLEKIKVILSSTLKGVFFQSLKTQKKEYYSDDELSEIVLTFYQVLQHLPQTHPQLNVISPYDEGGKEILSKALNAPEDLVEFLQIGSTSTDSAFNTKPPLKFKALLSESFEFNQYKSECIRYLSSLEENNRLKMDLYLKFLKNLEEKKIFHSTEKNEILKLILITTTSETVSVEQGYTLEDLKELVAEVEQLHGYGEEQLIYFCSAENLAQGAKLEDVTLALKCLQLGYRDTSKFEDTQALLFSFSSGEMSFPTFLEAIAVIVPYQAEGDLKDSISIDSLMERFSGTINDPNVLFPLSQSDLIVVKNQYIEVQKYCGEWKALRMCDLVNKALEIYEKAKIGQITQDDILQLYAIGRLAIREKFKIYLYNTQVCAALALNLHPEGILGQIKTGEGKSMIGALLAFVRSLSSSRQGHIISSDRKLAARDQGYFQEFFQTFNITTSHICEDNRVVKKFQSRLLYGTATDFEYALMHEILNKEEFFPDYIDPLGKRFSWVLVDEVDNLTIDTSRSSARLSFQAEVTYDWVYIPIFNFVKTFYHEDSDLLDDNQIIMKLKFFLKEFRGGVYAKYVDSLLDSKLMSWVQSAYIAIYKKKIRKDYVVGVQKVTNDESEKGVLIVDSGNTGRIMHGSRWSSGIHEFVEVKENLDVQKENVCPISISHPILYAMYDNLIGMSGTIGDEIDREGLFHVYGIRSFDVPTHNPPRRVDLPPVIFETTREYFEAIKQLHIDSKRRGQPVLNLNQTIHETEELAEIFMREKIPFELLNEVQRKDEDLILLQAALPGASIIATNTATRGTDIKLSSSSLDNGGLFVLISYFPENVRIEMQGRGRSGRQGQSGTSVIYLSKERLVKAHPIIAGMTNQEILNFLNEKRTEKGILQKGAELYYAKIERFKFEFVKLFYKELNYFSEISKGRSYVEMIASYLNGYKITKVPNKDYSSLKSNDLQIVRDVIKYLTNFDEDCLMSWKIIVRKVKDRIRQTIINEFALNFQTQVEEIVNESGITSLSLGESKFKQFLQNIITSIDSTGKLSADIDSFFENFLEEKLNDVKNAIKAVFKANMTNWKGYLNPSGRGIILYLSEIIGFDFTPLESDCRFPLLVDKSIQTKKGEVNMRDASSG